MKKQLRAIAMAFVAVVAVICLAGIVSAEEVPNPTDAPVIASPESQCASCPTPLVPAQTEAPAPAPTDSSTANQ